MMLMHSHVYDNSMSEIINYRRVPGCLVLFTLWFHWVTALAICSGAQCAVLQLGFVQHAVQMQGIDR